MTTTATDHPKLPDIQTTEAPDAHTGNGRSDQPSTAVRGDRNQPIARNSHRHEEILQLLRHSHTAGIPLNDPNSTF